MEDHVTHRCPTSSEDYVPLRSEASSELLAIRLRYIGRLASHLVTVRAQPDGAFGKHKVLNMLEKSNDYDIAEWLINKVGSGPRTALNDGTESGGAFEG